VDKIAATRSDCQSAVLREPVEIVVGASFSLSSQIATTGDRVDQKAASQETSMIIDAYAFTSK
jgi:hypothetical protein